MKIIDSQIHTWDHKKHGPAADDPAKLHRSQFTIDRVRDLLNVAGVHRAILVPPRWTNGDNDYSLQAARAEPDRFAVMGRLDVDVPDAKERLATWRDQQGMLGIRMFFGGSSSALILTTSEYRWFWQVVEETEMPIMTTRPGHIASFQLVLESHPELHLIIDHAGRHPNGAKDDGAWADARDLHALARYRNVAVKVSSLPCFTTDRYPFRNLHPHIEAIYDHFGPERMLWGSDATRLTCTYEENLRLFTEELDFLGDADKEWVMGRAAAKWSQWPL